MPKPMKISLISPRVTTKREERGRLPGSVLACSWTTGRLFFLYTDRDLIGLIIDLALAENQALARTPDRDYMDRTLAAGPVKRVPKRLAAHVGQWLEKSQTMHPMSVAPIRCCFCKHSCYSGVNLMETPLLKLWRSMESDRVCQMRRE